MNKLTIFVSLGQCNPQKEEIIKEKSCNLSQETMA